MVIRVYPPETSSAAIAPKTSGRKSAAVFSKRALRASMARTLVAGTSTSQPYNMPPIKVATDAICNHRMKRPRASYMR